MKFELNKNLFKVTHEGKEGYVIIDEISVSKEGEPYRGSISGNIYIKQKGVIQAGDKIIASTFPLGDLPQFIVEHEVGGFYDLSIHLDERNNVFPKYEELYRRKVLFNEGWNKHAEKYKFTEEDVKKAIQLAREADSIDSVVDLPIVLNYPNADNSDLQIKWTEEEIIQFLQQPKEITEIEFEVELTVVKHIPYPKELEVKGQGWEKGYPVTDYTLKITKSIKYPYGLLTIKNVNYN